MLGAIAGDIIGSVYEHRNIKTTEFPLFKESSRFTDDTVLTVATAEAILRGRDYGEMYRGYYRKYPMAGYGGGFIKWASSDSRGPYNSWGNGSAMRVSPVGFAFGSSREVLEQAKKSAEVTHNHPEGIKGAQALALAVFLAKQGSEKREIQQTIEDKFDYDLSEPVEEIRRVYTFDVSCQGSVPQALRCFLESEDFEDAIRKAVSIGGDSDTIACMAGAVSQAYFREIPEHIVLGVRARLNEAFLAIIEEFEGKLAL